MAYRAFSDAAFADTLPGIEPIALSPLERTTVLLSLHDGRCSLGTAGRFDKVVGALFGIVRPSHLADVRLEALRRYAVLLRLEGTDLDPDEVTKVRDLGFSAGQLIAVQVLLSQAT